MLYSHITLDSLSKIFCTKKQSEKPLILLKFLFWLFKKKSTTSFIV
jgi:hypothetical protein